MLAALEAAALMVVSGTSTGKPWTDRKFDLRVDDHPAPLVELHRLLTLQRAYTEAVSEQDVPSGRKRPSDF